MQTRGDFLAVESATDMVERGYLDERPPNVPTTAILVSMFGRASKSEGPLEGVIKIAGAKEDD